PIFMTFLEEEAADLPPSPLGGEGSGVREGPRLATPYFPAAPLLLMYANSPPTSPASRVKYSSFFWRRNSADTARSTSAPAIRRIGLKMSFVRAMSFSASL